MDSNKLNAALPVFTTVSFLQLYNISDTCNKAAIKGRPYDRGKCGGYERHHRLILISYQNLRTSDGSEQDKTSIKDVLTWET